MNLRLSCAMALVVLAGCGGSKTPTPVAEMPASITDVTVEPAPTCLEKPEPPVTLESLTGSLQQSIESGAYDDAIKFAERALELDPDSFSLLLVAAQLAQHQGTQEAESGGDTKVANALFFKSAGFVRRILKSKNELAEFPVKQLSQVFYNEACAYANLGENEKALASLRDAFDAGFDNYQLVESDAGLADLRKAPEFTELVTTRREEHQRRRLAEVKQDIAAQEPFEFDFDLLSTAGQTVKLADYKGKVLIVDFWGTWCPPCRQEIPHFVELLKNHRGAGLEIVGINYERGDPAEFNALINTFAKENSVTYPCLLGDEATQNRVPNLEGFPTTLFIDRSGKVRLQIVGYHPYDDLEIIVQTLLSEADGSTDG